jgi:hypothetical protein
MTFRHTILGWLLQCSPSILASMSWFEYRGGEMVTVHIGNLAIPKVFPFSTNATNQANPVGPKG